MIRGPGHIVLAAGGTGGHVIPAQALAEELVDRGYSLTLITDDRGLRYAGWFDEVECKAIATGRFAGASAMERIKAVGRICAGTWTSWRLLRRLRPDAVVGFGGYPSLPVMAAASLAGVPSCLHEQNAVLGRVNRLVAGWADALALSYRDTRYAKRVRGVRAVVTGNPVRRAVAALHGDGYPAPAPDGEVHILVLGGSQGATILSDVVPAALSVLPRYMRDRIKVVQQCRGEDLNRVYVRYREMAVEAEFAAFFDNIAERLAAAHLVISRAGASAVSEAAAAGRPAILVPLPTALDDHQTANARALDHHGGGWLMDQQNFTAGELAKRIRLLVSRPQLLSEAAARAREVARPQAASALADLVEWLARVRRPAGSRLQLGSRYAALDPGDHETDSENSRGVAA